MANEKKHQKSDGDEDRKTRDDRADRFTWSDSDIVIIHRAPSEAEKREKEAKRKERAKK